MADDPAYRVLPWVARPGTSIRKVNDPAFAVTRPRSVGSGMMQASPEWPRASAAYAPRPPSSSPTTKCTAYGGTVDRVCCTVATAPRMAATPPFMSQAPRPITRPPLTCGRKGSLVQAAGSPMGTTST